MIDFNEEFICFVRFKGVWNWYVSFKELWELDSRIVEESVKKAGYSLPENGLPDERQGTYVLDSHNAAIFLDKIENCKFEVDQLRKLLFAERENNPEDDDWYFEYLPSLYVDFDKKEFYSMCTEPASYEKHVPEGWTAEYEDFLDKVPRDYQYWLDENGNNVFRLWLENRKKGESNVR